MQKKVDLIRKNLLYLYIFTIPLSTAINNLLFGLIILFWIVWGDKKKTLNAIRNNPIVIAFYALFFLFALSLLWSDNKIEGLKLLKKEIFYLALPIFISLMKKEEIKNYIKSFLFAMFISEIFSYLIFFKIIPPILNATVYDPIPFMGPSGHISYNPMLVLSIYLLIYFLFNTKQNPFFKIVSIFFILTMTINLFITGGRAGQVAFFLMVFVIAMQFFKFNLKTFFLTLITVTTIFFISYNSSKIFYDRVNLAISNIKDFKKNQNTSVGRRLATWQNSLRIIKDSPILGTGAGDYKKIMQDYSNKYTPKLKILPQPHNMYLFAWVHSGIFAFISLLLIFIFQIRASFVIEDEYKPIRFALPILYLIIMLSESYLSIHYTKILFLVFSAMLFMELKFSDLKRKNEISIN